MELEENIGWQEKEEEFHRMTSIKRSQIRISEDRWTIIDMLAINIIGFTLDTKYHHKIKNPINLINESTLHDLASLLNDIDQFNKENDIDANDDEMKHWKMAKLYVEYIFNKRNLIDNYIDDDQIEDDENDHNIIKNTNNNNDIRESDIKIMDKIERENLANSSYEKLTEFENVCSKMASGKTSELGQQFANISVDVNYWTLALKITQICKAKAFITKKHKELIKKLQAEKEKIKASTDMFDVNNANNNGNDKNEERINTAFLIPNLLEQEKIDDDDIPMIDASHSMYTIYKQKAIDLDDDMEELDEMREKVLKQSMEKLKKQAANRKDSRSKPEIVSKTKETKSEISETKKLEIVKDSGRDLEMYEKIKKSTSQDGEHSYNKSEEEIPIELRTTYWWHDKYRPRKPRYFNRVKTGYSWNKYNQTHYDPDNPPPKIVQGYKFNIFYPDLIDPLTPPTYKLYEKGNNSEYAILIFHSGPPYQDIAFKIVNNEWEPSHRRGFRCRFEKGIFSLYFNFKRYRYRR